MAHIPIRIITEQKFPLWTRFHLKEVLDCFRLDLLLLLLVLIVLLLCVCVCVCVLIVIQFVLFGIL